MSRTDPHHRGASPLIAFVALTIAFLVVLLLLDRGGVPAPHPAPSGSTTGSSTASPTPS